MVKKWLGHEEIAKTNTYIGQATSYYNVLPVDWISLTLKPSQKCAKMAGKQNKGEIQRNAV